jgi:sugar lactone lactonase YvrE
MKLSTLAFRAALCTFVVVVAAACGGGDGGGNDSPTPQTASLEMFAGTWGPAASVDGTGTQANFYGVGDMAFDAEGNLLVLDVNVRKVTPQAQVSTLAPSGNFRTLAVDASGQVYVGEYQFGSCRLGICPFGGSIRRLAPDGTTAELAITSSSDGSEMGVRSVGDLVTASGNVYWTDIQLHAIRRLSPNGDLTTVAGIPGSRGSDDGPRATARFNFPQGLAIDTAGNLYVADGANYTIRKISASGSVTTLAGLPGVTGSQDGVGPDARFKSPLGIAVDEGGNVYVTELGNCTVRKVTPAGVVTTIAGTAGICDAFVAGALPGVLNNPGALAIRGSDLYIGMRHGIAVVRNRP